MQIHFQTIFVEVFIKIDKNKFGQIELTIQEEYEQFEEEKCQIEPIRVEMTYIGDEKKLSLKFP